MKRVFRLRYVSEHFCNGPLVDLAIHYVYENALEEAAEPTLQKRIFRLYDTYLDSMVSNLPLCPLPIKGVEKHFHGDVYTGVFAGDIGANKPLDWTLPQGNGFRDAYLELGVKKDAEEGCTWDFHGQEMARKRYGPTRLDEVLYCGEIGADWS